MANNKAFTSNEDFVCNLSTIAKSLVTLSRCGILSDETRRMVHEYMNFGATNQDWRVGLSLHDPDPTGLTFFFKLLVDLDMWSLANASLIVDNKKVVMEVIGHENHKLFATLLHKLRDRELLTPAVFQQIIGNEWIFQNLTSGAELCLFIIPNHLWTADLLQQVKQPVPHVQRVIQPHARGNAQSTHAMSVHTMVASSLHRLNDRYHLTESQINTKLSEFKAFADELTSGAYAHLDNEDLGDLRTTLSAQCVHRLVSLSNSHEAIEPMTKFSLRKVLALIWMGIQDESLHDTSLGFVIKDKLVNELYNIEVAYGISQDGRGLPSCFSGGINGLLLPLNRVHADVHIDLIDMPAVVEQTLIEAKTIFLEQFKSAVSHEKQGVFTQKYDIEMKK